MTESFRDMINRHIDAGTCHVCGKAVEDGAERHGATGAHWACETASRAAADTAFAKVDAAFSALGVRPRKRREGTGRTALKARDLAVQALEAALGTKVFDLRIWNQQGVYRGPRWDLDAWGLYFRYESGEHVFDGQASCLATMTHCVRNGRLKAHPGDMAGTFTLDLS